MACLIRNIVKVEVIESRWLQNIRIINNQDVFLNYYRNFTKLPTSGLSSIELSDRVENNNHLYTIKLQALLTESFFVNNRKLSFRATTASGESFLIGTNESPYSTVTIVDKYPSSVSEKSGCFLTVEYTNCFGMLKICG